MKKYSKIVLYYKGSMTSEIITPKIFKGNKETENDNFKRKHSKFSLLGLNKERNNSMDDSFDEGVNSLEFNLNGSSSVEDCLDENVNSLGVSFNRGSSVEDYLDESSSFNNFFKDSKSVT